MTKPSTSPGKRRSPREVIKTGAAKRAAEQAKNTEGTPAATPVPATVPAVDAAGAEAAAAGTTAVAVTPAPEASGINLADFLDQAHQAFIATLQWGDDAGVEDRKTAVLGNLNGFVAFLNTKLLDHGLMLLANDARAELDASDAVEDAERRLASLQVDIDDATLKLQDLQQQAEDLQTKSTNTPRANGLGADNSVRPASDATPVQIAQAAVTPILDLVDGHVADGNGEAALAVIDDHLADLGKARQAIDHAEPMLRKRRAEIGGDAAASGLVECWALEKVRHGGHEHAIGAPLRLPQTTFDQLAAAKVVTDVDPQIAAPAAE